MNHLNVALYSLINKPLGYGLNNYEVTFEIYKENIKVEKFEEIPCLESVNISNLIQIIQ